MKIEISINGKWTKIEWENREYSKEEILQILEDIKNVYIK